jgi:thiamine kinase-like enzyme
VTKKVLATAGIANAELLTERVNQALQSNGTVEPCLGMVDLWPGNILIDSHCNVGLVDWEYFGLSTASSELGMLGELLSALHRGNCG